jgi:flagellar basal body-associated protein FliL
MGKKGEGKKSRAPEKKKLNPVIVIAIVVIAGVAVLAVTGNLPFTGAKKETGRSFNLKGKETKKVLDPARFTGQARLAYAAAQKYPELMNEVFCYCYCDQPPFNHMSLLSCFTDNHGAG